MPSDFFNKILQTGLLINNRNLFLTVLEAGSPRSRLFVGPWLGCRWLNLHLTEETRGHYGISFIRVLAPF